MLVPMTREASVSCISLEDPAIDQDKVQRKDMLSKDGKTVLVKDAAVYLTERLRKPDSWRDTVPMKEGAKPTVFVIGVVPPSELNRIEDECRRLGETGRANELMWRCFLHGVRNIEGLGLDLVYSDVHGVKYVDPQWLADVFCGPLRKVALEIGTIIYNWNDLSQEAAGN